MEGDEGDRGPAGIIGTGVDREPAGIVEASDVNRGPAGIEEVDGTSGLSRKYGDTEHTGLILADPEFELLSCLSSVSVDMSACLLGSYTAVSYILVGTMLLLSPGCPWTL